MAISLTDPVFLRSSRYLLLRDLPPRPFQVLAGGATCLRAIQILMFWSTMPDLPGPGVDWIQVTIQVYSPNLLLGEA
jgi:hypothetical protein